MEFPLKKLVDEITSSIIKHSMWKFRLYETIWEGKSEWTVEDVKRDDLCEMGAFLKEFECKEECYCTSAKIVHKEFHLEAARVLELSLQGKKDEAKLAVVDESKFSVLSKELVELLSHCRETIAREGCPRIKQ